jgi:hypothetical protein
MSSLEFMTTILSRKRTINVQEVIHFPGIWHFVTGDFARSRVFLIFNG